MPVLDDRSQTGCGVSTAGQVIDLEPDRCARPGD